MAREEVMVPLGLVQELISATDELVKLMLDSGPAETASTVSFVLPRDKVCEALDHMSREAKAILRHCGRELGVKLDDEEESPWAALRRD